MRPNETLYAYPMIDEKDADPPANTPRWRKWAVRGLQGGATAFGILSGGGILVHALMSRAEKRRFTPPGRMLEIKGHSMHILAAGSGGPTVVLESSASGYSGTWEWVLRAVAMKTRVVAYDRAGLGYSERAAGRRDAASIAQELDELLAKAGEAPPYVLAGHSLGALLVMKYADLYPQKTAGLVLIDPFHPDQVSRNAELRKLTANARTMFHLASAASHLGIMRLTDAISNMTEGLSEDETARAKSFLVSARHLKASARELGAWKRTSDQTRSVHFGDVPLLILSADQPQLSWVKEFEALHHEMVRLSDQSAHRIVHGAEHLNIVTRPEHAANVAEAILEVVEYLRQR
jgi:pimeloyl-ACP methyl ester carboxylesterase